MKMPDRFPETLSQIEQYARALLAEHDHSPDEETRAKRGERLGHAVEQRDWKTALDWLPLPYHVDFFCRIQWELSDTEYARLLAKIWQDTELPSRILDSWIRLFTHPRLQREFLMTPKELAAYRALPDSVRIWRGVRWPRYARGISWTTDPDQAAWFAQRFASNDGGRIYSVTVRRQAIIAYFARESEAILDPRSLGPLRAAPLTPAEIQAAANRRKGRWRLSLPPSLSRNA
jgi:hypothetical protein